MTYKQPTNFEDYQRLAHANASIEGAGIDTHMVLSCPGCAAPGFVKCWVAPMELTGNPTAAEAMKTPVSCVECLRSFKMITRAAGHGTEFELVQTGGAALPDWLTSFCPIRRVEGMTIEDTQDVPLETDPARMAAKFDAALARAMDELTRQERTNASFVYSVCTDDDQAVCLDGILRLGDLVKAIINQ